MGTDIKSNPRIVMTKVVTPDGFSESATGAASKEHGVKIFTRSPWGATPPSKFDNSPNPPAFPVNMQYWGGPVLSSPVVVPIYLGDYFNSGEGKVFRESNDAAVSDMLKDPGFTSVWAEYGVGPGKREASHVVSGAYEAGRYVSDAEIQRILSNKVNRGEFSPKVAYQVGDGETWGSIAAKLIVSGALGVDQKAAVEVLKRMNPTAGDSPAGQTVLVPGRRNSSAIYTVVLPPEVVLTVGGGVDSTVGLGGYHSNIHDAQGNPVYYAAVAASTADNGIPFSPSALKNTTITEAHEISEAVTDPLIGDAAAANDFTQLGWYDLNNGEIGDIEVNDAAPGTPLSTMYGQINGPDMQQIAVQKIYGKDENLNEISTPHVGGPIEPLPPPVNLNSLINGAAKGDVNPKN
jgi:hypothetical protein